MINLYYLRIILNDITDKGVSEIIESFHIHFGQVAKSCSPLSMAQSIAFIIMMLIFSFSEFSILQKCINSIGH